MILYHQCCHHIPIKTTCSLKAHQHNNYIIESQSIKKPAHIRVIAFCWKRCELNMFWYHTADVLCTAAQWHEEKSISKFRMCYSLREPYDMTSWVISQKAQPVFQGRFFLDIEWRWSNDFIFSCHLYTPAWTSQNFEPPDRKGLCRVTWCGRSHGNRFWARLHPAARLAWIFQIHNSMQLWSHSAYLLSFPDAPWRLAAVCTSWPFGWFPLLPRRPLPRTGTVTAYVSLTLATADLAWLLWLSLPNASVCFSMWHFRV